MEVCVLCRAFFSRSAYAGILLCSFYDGFLFGGWECLVCLSESCRACYGAWGVVNTLGFVCFVFRFLFLFLCLHPRNGHAIHGHGSWAALFAAVNCRQTCGQTERQRGVDGGNGRVGDDEVEI